jgi:hypothetical protein
MTWTHQHNPWSGQRRRRGGLSGSERKLMSIFVKYVADDDHRLDRIVLALLMLGFLALQYDRGNMYVVLLFLVPVLHD